MLTPQQKTLMSGLLGGTAQASDPDLAAVAKEMEKIRIVTIFREFGLMPKPGEVFDHFVPKALTEKEWFEVTTLLNS